MCVVGATVVERESVREGDDKRDANLVQQEESTVAVRKGSSCTIVGLGGRRVCR